MMTFTFTEAELAYLNSQRLGRLATVAPDGTPQNNPVGFSVKAELGVIDIGGFNLAATRKYRNVEAGSAAAFVVDDLVSVQPWHVRGVEIRGTAEALDGKLIRIHPRTIFSWGLEPDARGRQKRVIA